MTINKLPNDVLLDMFKFYVDMPSLVDTCTMDSYIDRWQVLVHVCQRWRWLVFASPRRLRLELLCTNSRPVKTKLDIWPALPIIVYVDIWTLARHGVSNIVFALKQHHRVSAIEISNSPKSMLEEFAAIDKPFPVLEDLALWLNPENLDSPIFPDSFLGGSAPRLRTLHLDRIPFPALPKLLLSATDLDTLHLYWVPHSGFISPNAMAAALSALKRLKSFRLLFATSRSWAHRKHQHPSAVTRTILPALTDLRLRGDVEYMEDFMSQIDTPVIDVAYITIMFFGQTEPDTPLLRDFICRTEAFNYRAEVIIDKKCTSQNFF